MAKVMGLFPTPLYKVDGFASPEVTAALLELAGGLGSESNSADALLSHSAMLDPGKDPVFAEVARLAGDHLVAFGRLLLGAERRWLVKEMWLNRLDPGGSQFMHSHANSFVSGVLFATEPHPSARTLFRRPGGGAEFVFKNDVPEGHAASDQWVLPEASPGDLILYPSYLLHGVPPNEGGQRVTLAFNAIPDRLDSLGYQIGFTS